MNELIEEVARAIAAELRNCGGPIPEEYSDAARAAIKAIEASGYRVVKDEWPEMDGPIFSGGTKTSIPLEKLYVEIVTPEEDAK